MGDAAADGGLGRDAGIPRAPVGEFAAEPRVWTYLDLLGDHLHVARDLAGQHHHRTRGPKTAADGAGHVYLAARELGATPDRRPRLDGDGAAGHVDVASHAAGEGDGTPRRPHVALHEPAHHHRARAHDEIAPDGVTDGDTPAPRNQVPAHLR